MDPSALKPWLDLTISYGLQTIISALVIWLGYWYAPKLINSVIETNEKTPKAIEGLAAELNKTRNTLETGVALIRDVKEDSAAARTDLDDIKQAFRDGATVAKGVLLEKGVINRESDIIRDLGKIESLGDARREYEDRLRRKKPGA